MGVGWKRLRRCRRVKVQWRRKLREIMSEDEGQGMGR